MEKLKTYTEYKQFILDFMKPNERVILNYELRKHIGFTDKQYISNKTTCITKEKLGDTDYKIMYDTYLKNYDETYGTKEFYKYMKTEEGRNKVLPNKNDNCVDMGKYIDLFNRNINLEKELNRVCKKYIKANKEYCERLEIAENKHNGIEIKTLLTRQYQMLRETEKIYSQQLDKLKELINILN